MQLALLFKVETLEGKFLAVASKSAKIFPLQNFALFGILENYYIQIFFGTHRTTVQLRSSPSLKFFTVTDNTLSVNPSKFLAVQL